MLALALMTTGCNGSSDSSGSSSAIGGRTLGANGAESEPFAIRVQVLDANGAESDDFASGQQITFTMTAQNVSTQPQTFNIQPCFGPAAYAVFVQGTSDLDEVAGGYMQQGVECQALVNGGSPTTLAPGQSVTASITWPQGTTDGKLVPPGKYSVVVGIACVQSDACMPATGPGIYAVPLVDSTVYRSAAASFTIRP